MRLTKARVQGYRSIIDTGYFDVENDKTIFVGPNYKRRTTKQGNRAKVDFAGITKT